MSFEVEYCTICHLPINDDGTVSDCGAECDRQVVRELDPMHELNFNDDSSDRWTDAQDPSELYNNHYIENINDWVPEDEDER